MKFYASDKMKVYVLIVLLAGIFGASLYSYWWQGKNTVVDIEGNQYRPKSPLLPHKVYPVFSGDFRMKFAGKTYDATMSKREAFVYRTPPPVTDCQPMLVK